MLGNIWMVYSTFETELDDTIPVVHATITERRINGNLVAGNKTDLLLCPITQMYMF